MANINITYQQMEDAAARLADGRVEIDEKLNQLKALIDQLVAEGYVTDSSSKEFDAAFDEYVMGAQRVNEGLDGMARYLTTAAGTFRDADTQLASALQR